MKSLLLISWVFFFTPIFASQNTLPIGGQMYSDSAGQGARVAASSIFRIICRSNNFGGTGFLHKSGTIITAAHVVLGCQVENLEILAASGQTIKVAQVAADAPRDLALLVPAQKITGQCLAISTAAQFSLGAQVTTWGYPSGYSGALPLLSVGYLSGIDSVETVKDQKKLQWVINAAFNGGNSGGPLLNVEYQNIIGVVSSKLAPIPPSIESAITALSKQKSGFHYASSKPDGTQESVSESQMLAMIIQYLRSQTQLVVGYAVTLADLRDFLIALKIEP